MGGAGSWCPLVPGCTEGCYCRAPFHRGCCPPCALSLCMCMEDWVCTIYHFIRGHRALGPDGLEAMWSSVTVTLFPSVTEGGHSRTQALQ